MKRKFIILAFGLMISAVFFTHDSPAQAAIPWTQWVKELRAEAVAQGIRPDLFDQIFQNIKEPSHEILRFDRTQPEKRITFMKYRDTRADAFRIKLGRQEYKKYHPLLTEVGNHYGVNACFIVSLWGLETSYGRYMGKFPVIQSLATLAYDTRRSAFFRKQLLYALHIINEGHVKLEDFKGEWAGASGHPQFLPSSWHDYAVDYDKDGRKDIWKSFPDVFASIANYLLQHGWQKDQPWAIPVSLPANFDRALINGESTKPLQEWEKMGIKPLDGRTWPSQQLDASLIEPLGGPDILIFNNFKVLMKWNRSIYYAGTVGYMAEQICGRSLQ